jgi:adenylate cyclase
MLSAEHRRLGSRVLLAWPPMAGDADEQAWEAAGLLVPDTADGTERRELLRYLTSLGATLDDLVTADRDGQLRALASFVLRRSLWRFTAREIAVRAGVDVERVLQVSRVAGLPIPEPDEPAYREEDIEAVRAFVAGIELFGEAATTEFTRSVGFALGSVADSAMAVFGINVVERFDERGVSEVDRARTSVAASQMLAQQVPLVLEALFLHHVEVASQRALASAGITAHTAQLAVGFVDIIESTSLVQRLPPEVLAHAIGAFEQHAIEIVGSRHGRVVKTLGDEVMFVTSDVGVACDIALTLRDRMADDEQIAGVRGAIAFGPLVRGYGDFYGPEVTAAARAEKLAEPGAVVVLAPVREAVDEGFVFTSIGEHVLRGFDDPIELFTVERA